jgi:hypothetical protein
MTRTHNKKSPLLSLAAHRGDQQRAWWQSFFFFYPCTQGAYWIAPFILKNSRWWVGV